MNHWKILYFLPFIFIVYANLRIGFAVWYENKNTSFVPILGLMCFFLATLGLDKDYSPWIWLLVLLDIGTLVLLWSLPFILREWFVSSRFCRYRVYQNDTQILTLYQFKTHRHFYWEYIGKTHSENSPTLVGFGGDWTIVDDKLHLENVAVADIEHDEIVFTEILGEYYGKLRNQRLKMK